MRTITDNPFEEMQSHSTYSGQCMSQAQQPRSQSQPKQERGTQQSQSPRLINVPLRTTQQMTGQRVPVYQLPTDPEAVKAEGDKYTSSMTKLFIVATISWLVSLMIWVMEIFMPNLFSNLEINTNVFALLLLLLPVVIGVICICIRFKINSESSIRTDFGKIIGVLALISSIISAASIFIYPIMIGMLSNNDMLMALPFLIPSLIASAGPLSIL